MIGNEEDARAALSFARAYDHGYLLTDIGTSRLVYLINGVVYKVDRMGYDENNLEYERRQVLIDNLPEFVRIPEMALFTFGYDTVLACEYIVGEETGACSNFDYGIVCEDDGRCMSDNLLQKLLSLGWEDYSWGNAIVSDGIYYLVDVAR